MDVHAPHEAIHTWKDFWIHLGTITIGLLIAISLEQSVEALHHLHQRHQLENDLRAEGLKDRDAVAQDFQVMAGRRLRLLTLRDSVDKARATGDRSRIVFTPISSFDPRGPKSMQLFTMPSEDVWTTARESLLVELLPRSTAAMYARLYLQDETLAKHVDEWLDQGLEVISFENRFDDTVQGSVPDFGRMKDADLDEYSKLLTENITFLDRVVLRLRVFDTVDRAVLDGARSENEMFQAERERKK
jgi:hypothetical protein